MPHRGNHMPHVYIQGDRLFIGIEQLTLNHSHTHSHSLELIILATELAIKNLFTMVASPNPDATSITIFGATGIQGGSVLRHLLQSDKSYRIRHPGPYQGRRQEAF
jgi:hypothetical protein